jgi:hypothetical protein
MFKKIIFLSALISSLILVQALAQDKVMWEAKLQIQLMEDLQCSLLYATSVFESELGGKKSLSGRAHCRDKRAYDFSRPSPNSPFKFKNCEPVVC